LALHGFQGFLEIFLFPLESVNKPALILFGLRGAHPSQILLPPRQLLNSAE